MAQNMSVLVKEGNIDATSCDHAAQENFYVVQFLSDPYTLQQDEKVDGQLLQAGELVADV